MVEGIGTASARGLGGGKRVETICAAAPAPADIKLLIVGGRGACNDKGVAASVASGAAEVGAAIVDGTGMVVNLAVEDGEPLIVGDKQSEFVLTSGLVPADFLAVEVCGVGGVAEPVGESGRDILAMGTTAFGVPVHFDGDTACKEQFAYGTYLVVRTGVAELDGHFVEFKLVGVDLEFVFDVLSVPGAGGDAVVVVAAHLGVFPVVDNHAHGSGDAACETAHTVFFGNPIVVRLNLIPFGLDEHSFAIGVAGEGLVGELFPAFQHGVGGSGVAVLFVHNDTGVAVEHVLACRVDILGVKVAYRGVGKYGLGAVGGRDDDKTIASHVECIHGGNTQCGIVVLDGQFKIVGRYRGFRSGSHCEVVRTDLFSSQYVDVLGFCTANEEYANHEDDS